SHTHSFPTRRSSDLNRREDAKSVSRESYEQLLGMPWTSTANDELDNDFARRYSRAWGLGRQFQPAQAGLCSGAEIVEEIGLDPRSEEHTSELQSPCN